MEKIDILLWIVGGGLGLNFALMKIMWSSIDKRFDKVDEKFKKIDERFDKVDERFNRVETKINDLDKRLVAVETILHMKECCRISPDEIKKAV